MSELLAVACISFGAGSLLGFAAGMARIREAVLRHRRRYRPLSMSDPVPDRIDRHGRARYRRVGSTK